MVDHTYQLLFHFNVRHLQLMVDVSVGQLHLQLGKSLLKLLVLALKLLLLFFPLGEGSFELVEE